MRAYPEVDEDYRTLRVGSRIREHRKRHGWKLVDLAARLGISVGKLSAIENDKIAVDVDLFVGIAETCGVPFDVLLPPTPSSHFHIVRSRSIENEPPSTVKLVNRTSHKLISYHNRLWPLADRFIGKHIEPLALEIRSVGDGEVGYISHNHEEFLFLLHGEAECLIKTPDGLVRETLRAGECIYFASHLPHCIRSTGHRSALAIDVAYSLHVDDSESNNGNAGHTVYLTEAAQESVSDQVARKLVTLRHAFGMSVADFAKQLAISGRSLNRIEHGATRLSLDLLLRACRTFRKPKEYFLAGAPPARPFHYVLRAGNVRRTRSTSWRPDVNLCYQGAVSTSLADGFSNPGMRPYLIRIRELNERPGRLLRHSGEEFVYVLTGGVKLLTRRDKHSITERLLPGDSCFIDSSAPHRFVATQISPYEKAGAELLCVRWQPPKGSPQS